MRACKAAGLLGLLSCGLVFLGAVSTCESNETQREGYNLSWLQDAAVGAPRWSPDGAYITFIDDGRITSTGHAGEYFLLSTIYIVDTAGSRLNRVPEGPSAHELFEADENPAISPDGSRVAYNTHRYSNGLLWSKAYDHEIATSNLDGTDPQRLTTDGRGSIKPVWSPDGTRIALSTHMEEFTRDRQIFTMAPDGSDLRPVAPVEAGTTLGLTWSPDGRYIAFVTHKWPIEGDSRVSHFIAVASADGSDYRRIAESTFGEQDASYATRLWADPVWSPDSTRLAFTKHEEGGPALYTADRDGSNARRVFDSHVDSAVWSRDGAELRFVAPSNLWRGFNAHPAFRGPYAVYSVSADGADLRLISEIEPLSGHLQTVVVD